MEVATDNDALSISIRMDSIELGFDIMRELFSAIGGLCMLYDYKCYGTRMVATTEEGRRSATDAVRVQVRCR